MTVEDLNNLNINEAPKQTDLVDNFPKTTKLLEKQLKDKSENIQNILGNNELRQIFENILSNPENRQKLINELIQCPNDEVEVKGVILANLPEGYAYNVSTSEVIKTEVKKSEDYVGATIRDKKQETVTQQQEIVNQQEQTAEQQYKIDEAKKQLDETIKLRENLLQGHQDVDKETRKQAELVKQKLPDETKNQLKQRGYNDSDIDNYILVKVTLNEVKGNKDFDQKKVELFENSVKKLNTLDVFFKNLDNACNIPDTNLNSFSSKNITRTRHEFFNSNIGNQDLIETKKSNLKSRDYTDLFPDKSEKELINEYGKFLDNEQIKSLIVKYNNNENLTDEEKNYLITGCRSAKEQIDNKTKDMVEELCLISQIKGMYMCMGEGADFQMNKANEIESKDGILTLNGHIDGIDFSIRQDTNDPEARLQTSTRLRKKDNAFEIGNHFEDSNFILPSQSEVFNLAVKSVNSDGALQEAETPADYVSKLQDKIMSKMDDMYEDTKYANHYMHEQVKGEQIMDKSLALVKNIKKSEIPTPITESNRGLFDFVGLIHFNIKNSTSLEKDRMNSCLEKIQNLVNEYKDTEKQPEPGKYPPIIEHYLTDKVILKNTKTLLEGGVVEGESMFDLFGKYRDKFDQRSDGKFGMINYTSLENDLIPGNTSHSLIAKEFVESQDKNGADDGLWASLNTIENSFGISGVVSPIYVI